jgi:murein L,D-transpeptidase YcbB/YkuD
VVALHLAHDLLLGATPRTARGDWGIIDSADEAIDLDARLTTALAANDLDGFFKALSPRHPDYAKLKAAYSIEANAVRKRTLALNMERWRWMPLDLGPRHIIVNVPAFEATLEDAGKPARTWPVVVGKLSTPTPVLSAQVSGVIYNPWWEVPESIIKESVGALMRGSPAVAAARGYVLDQGRIRQKPGATNALGQMKLAMPNPQAIYLHDTPSKRHFALPVRAYSHGCIRVGNALDFAATLLEGSVTRAKADAIVKSAQTQMVPLKAPIPVYIGYFTAGVDAGGKVRFYPDIYGRDVLKLTAATAPQKNCGA